MFSNRLAFAALAVACIGAAAGGGYFATRQNNNVSALRSNETVGLGSRPAAIPVQETEAFVDETSRPAESPLDPSPTPTTTTPKRPLPEKKPAASSPVRSASSRPTTPPKSTPELLPAQDRSLAGNTVTAPAPPQTGAPLPVFVPPAEAPPPLPKAEDRSAQETPRPEPPQKSFEELVVPTDSVIGLQSETNLTSERARIEDRVEARVTRDVRVHDAVAIPAGARAVGTVVSVDRGGKFKERARLGIRFNMLVLVDGTRIPISTETIYRDGEPPGKDSAAKISGATVGGAILGAIFGGAKGAAIGATAGAGAGSASVMASERNAATLRSGEPMTVRILSPVSVTIEQK